MGQQQLLLLVLGIVIVGLAVVVGIQAFGENQKKSNQDAMVNDGVRFASDAQAWALKPDAFGGGSGNFDGLTWQHLGYEISGSTYANLNGTWSSPAVTNGSGGDAGEVLFSGTNVQADNAVSIRVCGLRSSDIRTAVGSIGDSPSAPAC
jgi:hypothetical protein